MKSQNIMEQRVRELKKLRSKRDELNNKIESIEDEIKKEMESENVYEFSGKDWKVTWNTVASTRFDQSSFKSSHPKLFEKFKQVSEYRRFLVNFS